MRHFVTRLVLALSFCLPVGAQTWTQLASDNTSGCSGTTASESHCYSAFTALWGSSGMTDTNPYFSTKRTPFYNPPPANVSGPATGNQTALSIRSMIPYETGPTFRSVPRTKVFAHYMPWFVTGSDPTNPSLTYDHSPVGYVSNNLTTVDRHLADMQARDYDGLVVMWVGGQQICRDPGDQNHAGDSFSATASYESNFLRSCPSAYSDQNETTIKVANTVAAHNLQFALMIDQAGFRSDNTCGPANNRPGFYLFSDPRAPACVQQRILRDLEYANNATYLANGSYYTANVNGVVRPIVFTFIAEEGWFTHCANSPFCVLVGGTVCTSSLDCWDKIWASVSAESDSLSSHPAVVFRNAGRFNSGGETFLLGALHSRSSGMYGWIQPSDASQQNFDLGISPTPITNATQDDFGGTYLQKWHGEARCTWDQNCTGAEQVADKPILAGKLAIAGVYKGFDNYRAFANPSFNPQRAYTSQVMAQDCGMVWKRSWDKIGENFSASNPLDMIQVATWNDYDEGTAVEPGIENCFTSPSGNAPGNTLNWVLFTPGTGHLVETIHHFEIYYEADTDGNNLTLLDANVQIPNPPPTPYDPATDPNRWRPTRCSPGECLTYSFQYDISSVINAHPGQSLYFYVKTVGKAGIANKISGSIPTGLSLTRPSRPSRNAPSSQDAFMEQQPAQNAIGTVKIYGFTGTVTVQENCHEEYTEDPNGGFGMWQTVCDTNTYNDTGEIAVTVGGLTKTVTYDYSSTPELLASQIAALFNQDTGAVVTASATDNVVYLLAKTAGTGGNQYSLAATTATYDFHFSSSSYSTNASGSTLSGGMN